MSIQVKLFAGLAERLGWREKRIEARAQLTIADIWTEVAGGEAPPDNMLCAINMEYAESDQAVADGDEVAFFPPVTGG
jgi:molybdopterin synthase sulfur carrier subunit